jgi:protein-tyrosine sulfotransferase
MNKRRTQYIYDLYYLIQRMKKLMPFGGYPLRGDRSYNPFFIIGSGRSGNTLLRRILCAHQDISIPPETYILGETIDLFRNYNQMPWRDLVYFTLSQFQFHQEFKTFDINLSPLAHRLLYALPHEKSLAFILDSFYRYYAELKVGGCKRWGDKTPLNTYFLNKIFSVFPEGQFIHILRDGVDVVYSYIQIGRYQDIASAAQRWMESVSAAQEFGRKHPDLFLEIRYEQLVSSPDKTIRRVCEFLGLSFGCHMLSSQETTNLMGDVTVYEHHRNVMEPISISSVGKGRKSFPAKDLEKIKSLIGDQLIKLGYEL